jgi:hypothetical protein
MDAVLTNAALLRLVVSFQAGLPGRVHAYWVRHRNWLTDCYDDGDREELFEPGNIVAIAVVRSDLAMLAELHALFLSSPYYRSMELLQFRNAMPLAASAGHEAVLAWLHGPPCHDGVTCDSRAAATAAILGHARALQWLLRSCDKCASELSIHTASRAAQRGHGDVVTCLYAQRPELFVSPAVLVSAVESGELDVVRFLHETAAASKTSQSRYCKGLLDKAAAAGHLDVLEYLHTHCSEAATTEAMNLAAANGHLPAVQFLHANRREGCTAYAMDQAAAQGHLHVVQFLHEHRHEGCTVYAMGGASRRGHLPVVQFLHDHRSEGCSSWALAEAAEKGHLEVVQFLHRHRHGMDWEDSALFRAARNGHLKVVEYLCEETRVGDRVFDARRAAKNAGHEAIVRALDIQVKRLLDEKDCEQREKLRRRKHAKAKKKRK